MSRKQLESVGHDWHITIHTQPRYLFQRIPRTAVSSQYDRHATLGWRVLWAIIDPPRAGDDAKDA